MYFVDPLTGKDQVPPESLLDSSMEFIAKARTQRPARRQVQSRSGARTAIAASGAGKDQIFIEGRFQRARIGNSKNRVGLLDVVSDPETRLGLPRDGETVVQIAAYAEIQRPVSLGDCVPHVESKFLHVGVAVEGVQPSAAGQVVGQQDWIEIGIKRSAGAFGLAAMCSAGEPAGALRGIGEARTGTLGSAAVDNVMQGAL